VFAFDVGEGGTKAGELVERLGWFVEQGIQTRLLSARGQGERPELAAVPPARHEFHWGVELHPAADGTAPTDREATEHDP
jgi:hypothetical protein